MNDGPLDGVAVLDFTRIVSGPLAGLLLGDLGADVLKVERVAVGDDARPYGVTDPKRMPGATFLALNRNKRSIGLDLGDPEGREIALKLLRRADVLIHNYRPGVMERFGLDYETVAGENPGLVYCDISGYGSVGPERESAANDLSVQAHTGLLSITGEADGPPVRVPTPVSDIGAGLYATIGVLAALYHRQATGRGQRVETNMFESQLNMMSYMFVDYWLNGVVPQRMGTGNRMGLPNEAFPTADGWVCIVASSDRRWLMCCEALDLAPLAIDPRFASLADRYRHRAELVAEVSAATRRLTTQECLVRLHEAGVPCSRVNTLPEVADDPQLHALDSVVEMTVAGLGSVKLLRSPLHLSLTPTSERLAPPGLGADTDAVLGELGLTATQITQLRERGVVG